MIMEGAVDPKTAICPKCKGKKLMDALILGEHLLVQCPVCRAAGAVPHAQRDARREKARLAELEKKVDLAQVRLF
jgi:hypothetical protein